MNTEFSETVKCFKAQIDELREDGCNKVADLIAEELEQYYRDQAAEARINRNYDDKWSHDF